MNQILIKFICTLKDPNEAKYQLLIKKRESTGLSTLMIEKLL